MAVRYVDIEDEQDVGQRADNYLMRVLKGVPRKHVYRIIRKGEVRVNGGRIQASYKLKLSDRVRIPPIRTRESLPVQFSPTAAQQLTKAILFEDEHYLVLNKPSGVAVHGGSSISAGVIEILREVMGNSRLELVHRLDRDTSGCLAIAKNRGALQLAQAQFRDRTVKKIYEVFVSGAWPGSLRTVQLKLKRYETSWGERRVRVDSHGQTARTDFSILDTAGDFATRLQATLHTGRTHQIRVHTSANKHPIIGDDKYAAHGASKGNAAADKHQPRLCLHAKKLVIPLGRDLLKVTAPIDPEMEEIWSELKGQKG